MKNYFSAIITFMMILVSLSCSHQDQVLEPNLDKARGARTASATSQNSCVCGSCGVLYQDSHVGNGEFTYQRIALSFPDNCVPQGASIGVAFEANQYPNRFYIEDANGNPVPNASSNNTPNGSNSNGWLGSADYQGPWAPGQNGGGLQNPGTGNVSFTKQSTTYYLVVQTVLPPAFNSQTSQPNPTGQDSWQVLVSCSQVNCPTVDPPCTSSCGVLYQNSHVGNGEFTYQRIALSFPDNCVPQGASIGVAFEANQYPNRFYIEDANGNPVPNASSNNTPNGSNSNGWLGSADYQGPWAPGQNGGGLQNPGTGNVSFTKQSTTYYLVVQTVLPPAFNSQTSQPNPTGQDSWQVLVSCSN